MSTPDNYGCLQHSTPHTHIMCVQMCVLSLLPMRVLASHHNALHLLTGGLAFIIHCLLLEKNVQCSETYRTQVVV